MAGPGRMSDGLPDVAYFQALKPLIRWHEYAQYIREFNTLPPEHAALRAATAAELLEDGRKQTWLADRINRSPSAVSRLLRRLADDSACQPQPIPQGASS